MKLGIMLALGVIAIATPALASQEGSLALSEFHLASKGIGKSGPIVVDGKRNDDGEFQSLTVTAGDTVIEIPEKYLKRISKFTNGVQISIDGGGPPEGIVILVFQYGFSALNSTYQRFVLVVPFDGAVRISEEDSFDKITPD